jgi:hypothetical protein
MWRIWLKPFVYLLPWLFIYFGIFKIIWKKNGKGSANLQQFEGKKPKKYGFFLDTCCLILTMPLQAVRRLGTSLLNTALIQGCLNRLVTTWWPQQLVTRLFQPVWFDLLLTSLLQVVPTTCYKSANQQLVPSLLTTSLLQLDKITSLLQLVNKLATSLFSQQLVNKLWDFYLCTLKFKAWRFFWTLLFFNFLSRRLCIWKVNFEKQDTTQFKEKCLQQQVCT